MPRVHFVKKARKAIPHAGVAVGDSYYWWKPRYGGKQVSRSRPRRSQLTSSEFLGAMFDFEDSLSSGPEGYGYAELQDFADALEETASEVESLGSEQSDKIYNMPESLQYSPTAELLQSRADFCDELAGALNEAAGEIRELSESYNWEGICQEVLALHGPDGHLHAAHLPGAFSEDWWRHAMDQYHTYGDDTGQWQEPDEGDVSSEVDNALGNLDWDVE